MPAYSTITINVTYFPSELFLQVTLPLFFFAYRATPILIIRNNLEVGGAVFSNKYTDMATNLQSPARGGRGQDKQVSTISTTRPSDTTRGWLLKWTNYIKGYQKRWFVLGNGLLSYYR